MTDKTRVLFLDVDGVLNTHRDWDSWSSGMSTLRLNRTLVDRLLEIVDKTACTIVLSSTWRLDEESRRFLTQMGVDIHSQTGPRQSIRGQEIKSWLEANPEVIRYVIVDDDSDMLLEQLPWFVQTDPEHGLTEAIAHRIVHRMNNGSRHLLESQT